MEAIQPIRVDARVAVSPERAFQAFVSELAAWWPAEYTWSGDTLERIAIEEGEGGLCSEWGPHGFRCDWGRVVGWEPPRRVAFTWQIGPDRTPQPDPGRASEVEVRFEPDGDGTRVTLEHRGFENHGEAGAGYREGMAAEAGWSWIVGRYAAHVG